MKDKIKIGIDAMKLISRATGLEVDGFSLKWEREFEKGTLRLPRTWSELKEVFIG